MENTHKEEKEKAVVEQKDLEFDHLNVYNAQAQPSKLGLCKYAVSFWRISKGGNHTQIKEYGFNGTPVDQKIHVSQCGNFIYFFLKIKDSPEGEG